MWDKNLPDGSYRVICSWVCTTVRGAAEGHHHAFFIGQGAAG